jgi:hypothetical protein
MACTVMKTILNCALLYYIVQFIFRRYYQHQGTDKFNKRHNVPVALIVIKIKLFPEDSYIVFKDILHALMDLLEPIEISRSIINHKGIL